MTLENLTSGTWWLTAVAGAVILKIIADYIKKGIDKIFVKVSDAWSSRTAAATQRFDRLVAKLKGNPELREWYFQREVRFRHRTTQGMIFGLIGIVGLTTIVLADTIKPAYSSSQPWWQTMAVIAGAYALFSTVALYAAMSSHTKAANIARALNKATGMPDLSDQESDTDAESR
ncbi:hypothetical protein [Burkholderia diffusa]|uniref:hypothetical protein n=1 Tax=Burkholderia diffusa TaxID=488732 RepID=UPI002AB191F6|nr:hypothetical protein [Burkholderia diffusa]